MSLNASLQLCEGCNQPGDILPLTNDSTAGVRLLQCGTLSCLGKSWLVCGLCPQGRTQYSSYKDVRLLNHMRRNHHKHLPKLIVRPLLSNDLSDRNDQQPEKRPRILDGRMIVYPAISELSHLCTQEELDMATDKTSLPPVSTNDSEPDSNSESSSDEAEESDEEKDSNIDDHPFSNKNEPRVTYDKDFAYKLLQQIKKQQSAQQFFSKTTATTNIPPSATQAIQRTAAEQPNQQTEKEQPPLPQLHCLRDESLAYFAHAANNRGLQFLVSKAQRRDGQWQISDREVALFCKLARFAFKLTRDERAQLCEFISLIQSPIGQSSFQQFNVNLPQTPQAMRRMVMEGKYAFIPNLPHPKVSRVDSCVYVSVTDTLAHKFAVGNYNFDTIKKHDYGSRGVTRTSQSQFAQRIRDDTVDLHLVAKVWSDGFEANYSSKQKRCNAWIMLLSIDPLNLETPISSGSKWRNAFPVAFGLEKDDHSPVERKFHAEMQSLDCKGGKQFYCGKTKRPIKVRISLVVVKADQPERRKKCGLMLVGSTFGVAFGMAGNYETISKKLPSCDDCLQSLLGRGVIVEDCPNCLNWILDRDCSMSMYDPPNHYPPSEIPEDGKLRVRKLNFEMLLLASKKAHYGIVNLGWNKQQTNAFLRTYAINEESAKGIIKHAESCWLKKEAIRLRDDDPHFYATVQECVAAAPLDFEIWTPPAPWTMGLELDQVVDVIMHLLFLGVCKTLFDDILTWAGKEGKTPPLLKFANGILESISNLRVDWCRPQPYKKGECGGWVSSDYLCLAKLMPWFFSMIDEIMAEEEDVTIDYKLEAPDWNVKTCKKWLRLRGLDQNGKAIDVKNRVHRYMKSEEGPPKRVINEPRPADVNRCVQSLFAMLSRLMIRETTEQRINEADIYVKVFLTYYSRFDDKMPSKSRGNKKNLPTYISKGNFLSLPRLIDTMRLLGPVILNWEGYVDGESFLRFVKPIIKHGVRKNWDLNTILKVVRWMAMDMLEDSPEWQRICHLDHLDTPSSTSGYRRYENFEEILAAFVNNKPLSGVCTVQGEYGFCVKRGCGQDDSFIPFRRVEFVKSKNAMAYHQWILVPSAAGRYERDPNEAKFLTCSIKACLLFLPHLCSKGFVDEQKETGLYTVITDYWEVLLRDGTFGAPTVDW